MLDEEHPAVHVVWVLCKLGLGGRDSVRIDRHDSQVLTGLLFSNLLFLQLDGQVLTGLPLLFSSLLQLNLSLAAESTLSSIPLFPSTTSALPQRYPHFWPTSEAHIASLSQALELSPIYPEQLKVADQIIVWSFGDGKKVYCCEIFFSNLSFP